MLKTKNIKLCQLATLRRDSICERHKLFANRHAQRRKQRGNTFSEKPSGSKSVVNALEVLDVAGLFNLKLTRHFSLFRFSACNLEVKNPRMNPKFATPRMRALPSYPARF
ncbi:hypothetical protein Tcan_01120, partial [Toxocara canis]